MEEVSIKRFEAKFRGDICCDVTALKIILDTDITRGYMPEEYKMDIGLMKSSTMAAPLEVVKRREIRKCFKSVMSSYQDCMDRLIAFLEYNKKR